MIKRILVFTTGFLFFASLSFAAVENIKVSGGIIATGISEDLSMGRTGTLSGTEQQDADSFLSSQVYLQFDADLTENVMATIRLLNERDWGTQKADAGDDLDISLDLAYISLKEMVYEPLTLIVGRQPLRYGRGLIIGDPDTNRLSDSNGVFSAAELSLKKSFDAIRAILDFSPWTVDLVYSKVDYSATVNIDNDVNLYGINLRYDWADYNGITELYFFTKDKDLALAVQDKKNKVYVVGLRGSFDPDDNWSLWGEGAYQFGDYRQPAIVAGDYAAGWAPTAGSHAVLRAWALQAGAEYKFLNDYNARLGLQYTFLSGDDETTGRYNAWNVMFEDQTPATLANILFPHSNIHCINLYGSMMPRDDITLWANYCHLTLAEKLNHMLTYRVISSRGTYVYGVDDSESDIGNEIDMGLIYDYTEDVQIGLASAVFIPGDWFRDENDSIAYQLKASMKVSF